MDFHVYSHFYDQKSSKEKIVVVLKKMTYIVNSSDMKLEFIIFLACETLFIIDEAFFYFRNLLLIFKNNNLVTVTVYARIAIRFARSYIEASLRFKSFNGQISDNS